MDSETDLCLGLSGIQLAGPDMLVDEYSQYNNDQQDVVNITPDDTPEEPAEAELMADDCTYGGGRNKTGSHTQRTPSRGLVNHLSSMLFRHFRVFVHG